MMLCMLVAAGACSDRGLTCPRLCLGSKHSYLGSTGAWAQAGRHPPQRNTPFADRAWEQHVPSAASTSHTGAWCVWHGLPACSSTCSSTVSYSHTVKHLMYTTRILISTVYVHLHMCMWSCSMQHLATHALCDACRVLGLLAAVSTRASAACSHHNIDVPCDEPPWMQSDAAEQHAARQAAACPMAAGWQEAVVGRLMWHAACSMQQVAEITCSIAGSRSTGRCHEQCSHVAHTIRRMLSFRRLSQFGEWCTHWVAVNMCHTCRCRSMAARREVTRTFWLLCTRQVHLKVRTFAQIPIA